MGGQGVLGLGEGGEEALDQDSRGPLFQMLPHCNLGQHLSLGGKRHVGPLTSLFSEGQCLDDSVF